MDLKLYFNKFTRATRPCWLLEELGVPYEKINLDLRAGAHKTPAYLAVHPLGKVPAMLIDGVPVFESGALVMHLADLFPEKGLAPAVGTIERAHYYQWIQFFSTTVEPPVGTYVAHTQFLPQDQRDANLAEKALGEIQAAFAVVEAAVTGKSYLVGGTFSAADVVAVSTLAWAGRLGLLDGFPALQAYTAAIAARPAFAAARQD